LLAVLADGGEDEAVIGRRDPRLAGRHIGVAAAVPFPLRIGVWAEVLERRDWVARTQHEVEGASLIARKTKSARTLASDVRDDGAGYAAKASTVVPDDLLRGGLIGLDDVRRITEAICRNARIEVGSQHFFVGESAGSIGREYRQSIG